MKNKLTILLFFVLTISFNIKAQVSIEKELIGSWKVVNVHLLIDKIQPDQKEKIDMLEKAFLVSRFVFKADKNFSFDFQFKDMAVKKGHWKYNSETKSVIVQSWKDKDTEMNKLLEVVVKKEAGKMYFLIAETFFELEMKKEK